MLRIRAFQNFLPFCFKYVIIIKVISIKFEHRFFWRKTWQ